MFLFAYPRIYSVVKIKRKHVAVQVLVTVYISTNSLNILLYPLPSNIYEILFSKIGLNPQFPNNILHKTTNKIKTLSMTWHHNRPRSFSLIWFTRSVHEAKPVGISTVCKLSANIKKVFLCRGVRYDDIKLWSILKLRRYNISQDSLMFLLCERTEL